MSLEFWSEDCPARGPALRHAHGSRCEIDHNNHGSNQCCHCGQRPPVRITAPDEPRLNPQEEPQMTERKNVDQLASLTPSEAAHIGFLAWRAKREDLS